MIARRATSQTIDLLSRFPAVVLIGPRQVGKTTLAQECATQLGGLYLDLESPSDLRKLSDPEDYLSQRDQQLIILDEIQCVPELFSSLRGLIDKARRNERRNGLFLLLGSASMEFIQQSSETLAGRIAYVELHSLDALETSPDSIHILWLRGGFPESYLSNDDASSSEYRDFLIRSYLERDVLLHGSRLSSAKWRNFWTMLAHAQGGIVNVSALSRNLEVDGRTLSAQLDLLENMLLIRKLSAWHQNTGKRLIKSPKIYIRDSGLLHELLGIGNAEILAGHPIIGASWEGFVIENLLSCAPARTEAYFYRSNAGAEIDLILQYRSGEIWAIEIKHGLVPKLSKGFYIAQADLAPQKSFVVYSGDDRYLLKPGIEAIGLRLLQKELLALAQNP